MPSPILMVKKPLETPPNISSTLPICGHATGYEQSHRGPSRAYTHGVTQSHQPYSSVSHTVREGAVTRLVSRVDSVSALAERGVKTALARACCSDMLA